MSRFPMCFWHPCVLKHVFYTGRCACDAVLWRVFNISLYQNTCFTKDGLAKVLFSFVFLTSLLPKTRVLRRLVRLWCHFMVCFWHPPVPKHVFCDGWLGKSVVSPYVFNISASQNTCFTKVGVVHVSFSHVFSTSLRLKTRVLHGSVCLWWCFVVCF